jgi:carbamoyltransferase
MRGRDFCRTSLQLKVIEGSSGEWSSAILMSTSFNLRGEVIVNTPTDAIRTFFSSGMDALVIGSFVVEK